jgi:hypothetical protein
MQYTVSFGGALSAELAQLLHAVQGQLNHRSIQAQASGDTPGSTDSAATAITIKPPPNNPCECKDLSKDCQATGRGGHGPEVPCPDTGRGGHGPEIVFGIVGLVIGLVIGFILGRRSIPRTTLH